MREARQARARHQGRVDKERDGGAVEDKGDARILSNSELNVASLVSLLRSIDLWLTVGKQNVPPISKKRKDSESGLEDDGVEPVVCYRSCS